MKYKYTHCIAYVARIPWLRFLRIDGLWWWRVLELDKTGPKSRMHTASASNHESHFNRFLLQNNSTGWGQVRDFVRFLYTYAVYIKYIVLYIYRLHTYPKDSAVANNDFSRRNENKKSCGTRPGQDAGGHQRHGEHSCLGGGGSYQQLMGFLMFWTAGLGVCGMLLNMWLKHRPLRRGASLTNLLLVCRPWTSFNR